MKALKLLLEKGSIDVDVLIIDEMHLQRSCEYSRGVFVRRDENGENGIMVFMVVSVKKSIPFFIKSLNKNRWYVAFFTNYQKD